MKLIMNIPDHIYEMVTNTGTFGCYRFDTRKAIKKGTPLPEGHGRLCDLDAALKCVDNDSVTDCDAKWQAIRLFEWAMAKRVVIEADKEITNETVN